eukprot:TRINITY_DN27854_c0_g1_i1.p1 TRINITY_DN27854_c0_g1~~TRINITY_DN27854_c0_g1_i1.p1  ORF type:complete len:1326 (+),score=370.54 TRINITY_DN27854_c0_g1_i1:32-4009(+)
MFQPLPRCSTGASSTSGGDLAESRPELQEEFALLLEAEVAEHAAEEQRFQSQASELKARERAPQGEEQNVSGAQDIQTVRSQEAKAGKTPGAKQAEFVEIAAHEAEQDQSLRTELAESMQMTADESAVGGCHQAELAEPEEGETQEAEIRRSHVAELAESAQMVTHEAAVSWHNQSELAESEDGETRESEMRRSLQAELSESAQMVIHEAVVLGHNQSEQAESEDGETCEAEMRGSHLAELAESAQVTTPTVVRGQNQSEPAESEEGELHEADIREPFLAQLAQSDVKAAERWEDSLAEQEARDAQPENKQELSEAAHEAVANVAAVTGEAELAEPRDAKAEFLAASAEDLPDSAEKGTTTAKLRDTEHEEETVHDKAHAVTSIELESPTSAISVASSESGVSLVETHGVEKLDDMDGSCAGEPHQLSASAVQCEDLRSAGTATPPGAVTPIVAEQDSPERLATKVGLLLPPPVDAEVCSGRELWNVTGAGEQVCPASSHSLEDMREDNASEASAIRSAAQESHILVSTVAGTTWKLEGLNPETVTMEKLRSSIEEATGVPVGRQVLFCGGTCIDKDDVELSSLCDPGQNLEFTLIRSALTSVPSHMFVSWSWDVNRAKFAKSAQMHLVRDRCSPLSLEYELGKGPDPTRLVMCLQRDGDWSAACHCYDGDWHLQTFAEVLPSADVCPGRTAKGNLLEVEFSREEHCSQRVLPHAHWHAVRCREEEAAQICLEEMEARRLLQESRAQAQLFEEQVMQKTHEAEEAQAEHQRRQASWAEEQDESRRGFREEAQKQAEEAKHWLDSLRAETSQSLGLLRGEAEAQAASSERACEAEGVAQDLAEHLREALGKAEESCSTQASVVEQLEAEAEELARLQAASQRGRLEEAKRFELVAAELHACEERELMRVAEDAALRAQRSTLGRCLRRPVDPDALCAELMDMQAAAKLQAREARQQMEQEELTRQRLDEVLKTSREELESQRNAARHVRCEEEKSGRPADQGALHPPKALLLETAPFSVRIPRFETERCGLLSSRSLYTIVVEGPGITQTLTKRWDDFHELNSQLLEKPFADTLEALPRDWLVAQLSNMMLERQRRLLEAYLARLCIHARVLLDDALWQWLAVDDLTKLVVRLVAASNLGLAVEASSVSQTLQALVASGGDMSRCVHPAVLAVLKEVLLDSTDELGQTAAARLLEQLLASSPRARQLFLMPEAQGAAALTAVCQGASPLAGRAAASAIQRLLESVGAAECEDASSPNRAARGQSSAPEAASELGECCVCLDHAKTHAMLPCGHLCACMECSAYLIARSQPCPVCRQAVERSAQIFV